MAEDLRGVQNPDEAKMAVDALVRDLADVIVKHIRPWSPKVRWMIASRALNSIYMTHYGFSINLAGDKAESDHSMVIKE